MQGGEALAGEDAREPAGRRGKPAKEDYSCSSKAPETGAIQRALSATALCYARFEQSVTTFAKANSVTAFHFFAIFAA